MLGLLLAFGARADVKVGDAFPALEAAGLAGELPATGGRVTVVDFWASWCTPCKASFPAYAKIEADYGPRGVTLVAVSVDDRRSDYEAFLRKWRPPFATVLDAQKKLVTAVKVPAMPTCYVLDRAGRVRFVHVGFHGAETEKQLRAQLEELLGEKP
jgi:thiol-disulfide isomerase/thioredoxin